MASPNFTVLRQSKAYVHQRKDDELGQEVLPFDAERRLESDHVPVSKYSNSRLGETMPAGSQCPAWTVICHRDTKDVKAMPLKVMPPVCRWARHLKRRP